MKRCPICGNAEKFHITAYVTQDWEVNGTGDFQNCLNDCIEGTHFPDDEDIWDCAVCGYSTEGGKFNVRSD